MRREQKLRIHPEICHLFYINISQSPQKSGNQASIDDIAGSWSGAADGDDGVYEIYFEILDGCDLNEICGAFNVPVSDCSGDLIFIQVPDDSQDKYQYRETNETKGCYEGEEDLWLRLLGNGNLEYHAEGDYGTDHGILSRQTVD